jgi:hypothetical protein
MSSKVETSRETTRTLNYRIESLASPPRAAGAFIMLVAAGLLYFGEGFHPRNKRMTANGKELLLYFAKLSECDTSSCRFAFNAALDEKRSEDVPASKSTACESVLRFVSIGVVRGQQNFPKAV